jgi:hypothetical protein
VLFSAVAAGLTAVAGGLEVSHLRCGGAQSQGQEQAEATTKIPTLNFAKNAKFRMGHPATPDPLPSLAVDFFSRGIHMALMLV